MLENQDLVRSLVAQYGSPLYVFDQPAFIANYNNLQAAFGNVYSNYRIAYSFKTNYTPFIANTVKSLGGYAEVVSGMEYSLAKKIGFQDSRIIFNGPDKGKAGTEAFLNGCILNVDSLDELEDIIDVAATHQDRQFSIGLRINLDLGQDFISRFGLDPDDAGKAKERIAGQPNLRLAGLHCHISRCRGLEAWTKRADLMIGLADTLFDGVPDYIDLGSGMFGTMDPEFASQFDNVPTYEQYANEVAGRFAKRYKNNRPILFTEPGTTVVNRFVDFISTVDAVKQVRNKHFAILDCSIHNLGETCTLKQLPMRVFGDSEEKYNVDITGYTCLEQDVMRKGYNGKIGKGDLVVFGNVGGYSNVLKPPFIRSNCRMVAITENGTIEIKEKESFDDIFRTYSTATLPGITVLVTAAGNVFMPGTTACLRNNGERHIRLIGADMNDDKTMLDMFDAYYAVPKATDPAYVKTLLSICEKEHVDIVLPIMSAELEAVAANRSEFEKIGTKVSVSNLAQLGIANDKLLLFDFLKANGLPCAEYEKVFSASELEEAAKRLGYPNKKVCVKATHGSGSRGFRVLDANRSRYDAFFNEKPNSSNITLDELLSILNEKDTIPELLVMEYLPGAEYTVDLLADNGNVLFNCCRQSTNMDNSIMLDGIIVDNKKVTDLCADITNALFLDGNIGFDVRERGDGTPVVMECNPRITAGIPAFAAAGVNLPYLCIKKLLGEPLPNVSLNYGLKMKRRYCEMYDGGAK